jgi:integrase
MILLEPGDVKERDWKRVPIHRDLAAILEKVMRVAPMGNQSVFHRDGEPINHKDQVRWCWDRKVIKANLDPFPHFHDLRHTWKTNARRSGVHPEIEKAIMGHADRGRTVHEGYGRISDRELLKAIDLMTFDHGPTEILVSGYK